MIDAKLGHFLDKPLRPLIRKVTIDPNYFTVLGFLITLLAAIVLPFSIKAGGILILFGGLFDMLDGIVARINNKESVFGAFLDSLLDRVSDALIFLSLGIYFVLAEQSFYAVLSIIALIGAYSVSYTRARAEGLGYECRVGIFERPERIILLAAGCLFPQILILMFWVVLIGSYFTVVQRVLHVKAEMNKEKKTEMSAPPLNP